MVRVREVQSSNLRAPTVDHMVNHQLALSQVIANFIHYIDSVGRSEGCLAESLAIDALPAASIRTWCLKYIRQNNANTTASLRRQHFTFGRL